jgi:hypothetical protein
VSMGDGSVAKALPSQRRSVRAAALRGWSDRGQRPTHMTVVKLKVGSVRGVRLQGSVSAGEV